MKVRGVIIALAVVVFTGTMAYVALADEYGSDKYGPADSSMSASPENGSAASETGEIREPVETGAVPDKVLSPSDSDFGCCSNGGKVQTFEYGGIPLRHGIDDGP